mmetsp:Transcript_58142/g.185032  ORF Transcript_58142/g.185032 Transcript_58142/m.185032 type:complete len:93 (-) Transcript_58142:45-323(-)
MRLAFKERGVHRGGPSRELLRKYPPKIENPQAVDAHNYMRIRTMSEDALRRRVWKIKRVDKLESFHRIMVVMGNDDLREEAEKALREIGVEI